MIEYLVDDILIHLINNDHHLPSIGSLVVDRFKNRLFKAMLSFLDEISCVNNTASVEKLASDDIVDLRGKNRFEF